MDNQSRLKIYFGPHERLQVNSAPVSPAKPAGANVTVQLSDIIEPLTDAIDADRTWLRDFSDDAVTISQDLYEILKVYRDLKKSA